MTFDLDDVRRFAESYLLPFSVKLLMGVAIFVIGRYVSRLVLRGFDRVLVRSRVDVSLRKFLGDITNAALFVVIVLAGLDTIGVKTTALLAVLGGAALAIGLALQGSLSNFAAGVMLIVLRPYKVNDWVTIGKYTGRVDAIRVFNTVLVTGDSREITIPNGQIITAPIENLTALGQRRIDLIVNVPLSADLGAVRRVLQDAMAADSRIASSPAATIDVGEITDGGVKLLLRPWTTSGDHFRVMVELMEHAQQAMVAAGIKGSIGANPPLVPIPVATS
ncbi:MAG TPA: mechanosensitive ion channel domain-containing protein [Kofleriaceae bacterium]|jgi:small conductance mechanosensitive channel